MDTKKLLKEELNKMKNLMNYMEGKKIINEESGENIRKQLHRLVGNAMRLGKRADMSGAEHHVKAYKEAEMELEKFLKENPSMMEYVEDVEEHFSKELYG